MKRIFMLSLMVVALSSGVSNAQTATPPAVGAELKSKRDSHRQELIASLPKDKAEMLKKAQDTQKAKAEEIKNKVKALRKEQRNLLKEEKFNKDAYMKKSEEISKLESEKFISRSEATAELASKFTVSERKVLMGAFSRGEKK